MARVDANVILRYLTGQPPDQAEQAARLFRRVGAGELVVAVDEITVAEVVWTLNSYYRMNRKEIAETMLQLLSPEGIICGEAKVVETALILYETRNVDFVDALLCAKMIEGSDTDIYSFDRHFDKVQGITRLEPG